LITARRGISDKSLATECERFCARLIRLGFDPAQAQRGAVALTVFMSEKPTRQEVWDATNAILGSATQPRVADFHDDQAELI
jgi:hypothetical protein